VENNMEILASKETGLGGKYVLVKYDNEFYAHGIEADIHDKWGFPVDSCGSKTEVLNHCKSIAELCKELVKKYTDEKCEVLRNQNQKELEALEEFISVLSK
jgi:hypothetical protein